MYTSFISCLSYEDPTEPRPSGSGAVNAHLGALTAPLPDGRGSGFFLKTMQNINILSVSTKFLMNWWSRGGSNSRPPACKAGALPAELRPQYSTNSVGWAGKPSKGIFSNTSVFAGLYSPAYVAPGCKTNCAGTLMKSYFDIY